MFTKNVLGKSDSIESAAVDDISLSLRHYYFCAWSGNAYAACANYHEDAKQHYLSSGGAAVESPQQHVKSD